MSTNNGKLKLKSILLFLAFTLAIAIVVSLFVIFVLSGKNDLAKWQDLDERSALLEHLLQEPPKSDVSRKSLSSKSPIYGLSETAVISMLGNPDSTYPGAVTYEVGNIDVDMIGNLIVPQTATLHLFFIDGKCVEYAIAT